MVKSTPRTPVTTLGFWIRMVTIFATGAIPTEPESELDYEIEEFDSTGRNVGDLGQVQKLARIMAPFGRAGGM